MNGVVCAELSLSAQLGAGAAGARRAVLARDVWPLAVQFVHKHDEALGLPHLKGKRQSVANVAL